MQGRHSVRNLFVAAAKRFSESTLGIIAIQQASIHLKETHAREVEARAAKAIRDLRHQVSELTDQVVRYRNQASASRDQARAQTEAYAKSLEMVQGVGDNIAQELARVDSLLRASHDDPRATTETIASIRMKERRMALDEASRLTEEIAERTTVGR